MDDYRNGLKQEVYWRALADTENALRNCIDWIEDDGRDIARRRFGPAGDLLTTVSNRLRDFRDAINRCVNYGDDTRTVDWEAVDSLPPEVKEAVEKRVKEILRQMVATAAKETK